MGQYGSIWVHMGPYGSIWVHMGPCGSLWILRGPSLLIWVHMGPYGSFCVHVGPYRSTWVHMCSWGPKHDTTSKWLGPGTRHENERATGRTSVLISECEMSVCLGPLGQKYYTEIKMAWSDKKRHKRKVRCFDAFRCQRVRFHGVPLPGGSAPQRDQAGGVEKTRTQ